MPSNRGVILQKQGVSVENIPYPKLEINENGKKRSCNHGVILKVIASNICGSDMHMVRERTSAKPGLQLGHEITGEIVEVGSDVEFLKVGDWVSVPFNVACGRCKNCIERNTNICLNVNSKMPGGAYGFADMGCWPGGQSEFCLVPYADFNLLPFPKNVTKDQLLDIALLSDILPTAYHGAVCAGVTTGSSVYIAGAGPVGLCAVACCQLLGAGNIFIGDYELDRLQQAMKMGAITIDLNSTDVASVVEKITKNPLVDASIDCVGFESCGHHGMSRHSQEETAEVLNTAIKITRFGGGVGIPGIYLPDPGADNEHGKKGKYSISFGEAWGKAQLIKGGQCPVMKYNRLLLNAILAGRLSVAKFLNINLIQLDDAPKAYKEFNYGASKKFIFDPHNIVGHHPISK